MKSERAKIKFGAIRKLKTNLTHIKEGLKMEWRYRHSDGYTEAIKIDLAKIHSVLFALRAAEKQIPMPMVVKVLYGIHKQCDGTVKGYIEHDRFCPCCGNYIVGVGTPKHRVEKYCYHCGQKLWWPKN